MRLNQFWFPAPAEIGLQLTPQRWVMYDFETRPAHANEETHPPWDVSRSAGDKTTKIRFSEPWMENNRVEEQSAANIEPANIEIII